MKMLRTLSFSAFVVSSLALQAPLTKEQMHLEQSDNSDWEFMKSQFIEDTVFSQLTCDSPSYKTYFDVVKRYFPDFSLSSLRIPDNAKILFYGTSYLHQIVENIVVANSDILIKNGYFGGLEGSSRADDKSWDMPGYETTWNFTNGATIREVQNFEALQDASTGLIQAFMNTNSFDIAFFMNPHPYCMFYPADEGSDYCRCYHACLLKANDEQFPPEFSRIPRQKSIDCPVACNAQFDGDLRGERADAAPLWDTINDAVNGNAYEVEAWSTSPRTLFHADEEHTILTFQKLVRGSCNHEDNCTASALPTGHQCQPGVLTTISETVMEKVIAKMR